MKFLKGIIAAYKRAKLKTTDAKRSSEAVEEANRLRKETGRKHYVLKLGQYYLVFNKTQINNLRKKGILRKDLDFLMLDKVAYFIAH